VTYTLVAGSSVIDVMPDALMVGLFATSGSNGTAGSSTIDSVSVGALGTAPAPPASASPCPSGWSCTDVGNPPAVGDQSLSAGTWTIKGAGVASGNNAYTDQFHLVWQAIAGDATLSARVATQANTSASAQAGLVVRADGSSAGAVSYGAFLTPTNGIEVVNRTSSGLRTLLVTTAAGAAPAYLEITRYGNTYTTFTSPDGVTWTAIVGSSVTFGAGGPMVAGIAVNSNSGTTLVTDTFDTVSLTGSAAPPPSLCPTGWTCQDIGYPQPGAGSQYVAGSTLSVAAGGGDIWGVYDSFRLLSQPLAADGTVSVHVDSQTNTSPWAKAGVMIRATNDPGSPYFAAFVTPANGVAVQWRTALAGVSSQVLVAGSVPAWLEVARSGSTFTAYTSADGVTWTAIPNASMGITMPGTLLAGLAVTSHNGGQMGATTFDTATLTGGAQTPPGACPTGWTCADIGNVGVVGGQALTSGTWTVQGGGGDIWDVADNFHYVWKSLATDGGVSTRVVSQTNTSPWAKAGVMLRATTDPGSPYYAAFVTPANGLSIQWRSAQAGLSTQLLAAGTTPIYLEVTRAAGSYSAYTSPNGVNWTLVPGSTVNLGLTGTVLAGMGVSSHTWGVLGAATFDTVALTGLTSPWLDSDIGAPALAGSASSSGGVFTVSAGGSDIYGTADQLNFAYQSASGDTTLGARVVTQTNTSTWAKAGVMLRATTNPGSPYYAAFVTPGNGVAVQWRKTLGATTSQVKTTGTVPVYLKVTRAGSTFTAYTSTNGSTWTLVPGSSVTFTTPTALLAGLAATSHNAAKLGIVTFDTVALNGSAPPPPNDFSIAAAPATLPVVVGSAAATSISTTLVSGSAETVALAASGLPTGVTAGFSATSVTAGGSSALTLTVGASVAAGSYPITVTGTAPSATHTTTVTLTVTVPALNDFSIGANPSTVSITAGGSGSTAVNTAVVSGSAEAIALSASGLPAGASAGFVPASVAAGGSSTLTFTVGTSVATGSYPITVTGTAPSATHTTTVTLTVTAVSSGLPSPWLDTDVGAPSPAGSATYAAGVYTVKGSGADIFGTNDQFNYVYQPTSGNGTIIARVASESNAGSTNDKAGVIWKASTTAGSPYILIAVSYTGLVKVQYNFSGSVTTSTYTFPNAWMKLVRSGSLFSAYLSPDGVTWTSVLANQSLPTIPTAATVGLFECSHKPGVLGTATFDNVSFTPGP
jgi:hypothetical protein